jgi:hypothetical protein
MRPSRILLPLLVSALAAGPVSLAVGAAPAAAATPPPAPAFTSPLALNDASGSSTNGSEPSIAVDSHDNIYVSAPASVPFGGCPFWYVHKDGTSYDYRGTMDTDQGSVGGGDCDISTTTIPGAQFDDVSVTSLSVANLTSNVTMDGGATWQTVANSASQQIFGVDRQWQGADSGLGRHYQSVHDLATTNIQVSVSTDGGYQYVQNSFAIDPRTNRKALSSGVSISTVDGSNHFGAMVVDPATHHLFIPFLAPVEGSSGFQEHTLYIAEGDPCPAGQCNLPGGVPAPITWTSYKAFEAPAADNLSNDFPALAMGSDGMLYAAFSGAVTNPANSTAADVYSKSRIFVVHGATPHTAAGTWSTPVAVDPGTGNSNVFPWLVAGSAGNVGVAWYGSTLSNANSCPGAGSMGNGTSVSDNCLNVWHVGYAQSSDASAASPTYTATDISGTVHKGPICNQGLSCASGTRTMLDFFDVALDSLGRANIVYVSDMRSLDTADVQFTRQCSGTSLTGVALPGCATGGGTTGGGTTGGATTGTTGTPVPTNCVAPQITDVAGDATQTVVLDAHQPATNEPDVDLVDAGLTWDAAKNALVGVLHVSDLSAPPASAEYFRLDFTVNGTAYELQAQRDGAGTASYTWSKPALGGSVIGSVTGSFDAAHNAVTIELPAATYSATETTKPPLGEGSVFTQLSALGQRFVGAQGPDGTPVEGTGGGATPTVDTATAPAGCVYTAAPPPALPEVPYVALLPLAGVAVMGGRYVRRRRLAARV